MTKIKFKKISVRPEIYERLKEDRQNFQETIGGGHWSISDVILEYWKMLDDYKKNNK